MSRNSSPSLLVLLMHLVLTVVTGGFWLVVLIIHYILKNR